MAVKSCIKLGPEYFRLGLSAYKNKHSSLLDHVLYFDIKKSFIENDLIFFSFVLENVL
jgi:hypothetical protein